MRGSAEKEIRNLPHGVRQRVVTTIQALAEAPRPQGCQKLSGRDAWRLRVGRYRIVDTIQDDALIIEAVKVAHRRKVTR